MRLVLASLVVLAGCASHSGVVQIGPDTYMVNRQAATGFPGLGNMKTELIAEGAAHCRADGKEFQLLNAVETRPPYILGNYPRSEIQFACVTKSSPAAQR